MNCLQLRKFRSKRSKYNNRKVVVDGFKFDSVKESTRYRVLKAMQDSGLIRNLTVHPTFVLQEKFKDQFGFLHRAIKYEADSQYFDVKLNSLVIEDVKAMNRKTGKLLLTEVYKIKKKMLIRHLPPGVVFREYF